MWPFRKPAKPDYNLLKGVRAYQAARSPLEKHIIGAWINGRAITQQAAGALIGTFGSPVAQEAEPIGDSSDGIAPCDYKEL